MHAKTKIVATIGPKTNNEQSLKDLYAAGMRVARLNGSHADTDWHSATIKLIQKTLPNTPILLDIPGKKIRTTLLEVEPTFKKGDTIILTTDTSYNGEVKVPVNYPLLHEDLSAGNTVLADDGTLKFTVAKVEGKDMYLTAEVGGQLKSRKGINVPFVKLQMPLVTDRDKVMMKFAIEHDIDFIGVSFVESANHIQKIRELTPHDWPRIVAKIENQPGADNMVEIIEEADAIMIDRGDLSVETKLETITIVQKQVLKVAEEKATPVIIATEMLHTMMQNPFPTKAEVSDISNAVLDGAAAVMLSGETAIGDFGVEAVSVMTSVGQAIASYRDGEVKANERRSHKAIEESAYTLCNTLDIDKIVILTHSGFAARALAGKRPSQPILAVSDDIKVVKSMNLLYGTRGYLSVCDFSTNDLSHMGQNLCHLYKTGELEATDQILVVGALFPYEGSLMNTIMVHKVSALAATLGWGEPETVKLTAVAS